MKEPLELILAGHGGQGILTAAEVLGWAVVTLSGRNAACVMDYGAEMRGGYIRCSMGIDEGEVISPLVEHPHVVLCMNEKELAHFQGAARPGGYMVANTSLSKPEPRTDVQVVGVPCNDLAQELGSDKVLSMVGLGALVELTKAVTVDDVEEGLKKILPKRHHRLIPLNLEALKAGMGAARSSLKEPTDK